jgi:hypothetical protein
VRFGALERRWNGAGQIQRGFPRILRINADYPVRDSMVVSAL